MKYDSENIRFRNLNGYRVIYLPAYHKAMTSKNWKGFVYEHIVVAENKIGRPLKVDEVVHHIDEDRGNNDPSNLEVMTRQEHAAHHGARPYPKPSCLVCSKTVATYRNKFCSSECRSFKRRKAERPSKEELTELIKNNSLCALGRKFGVSNNAIRKWAKSYNIKLKPSKRRTS